MDLALNIMIPLLLILTIAGTIQPKLFVFWSARKTRLQGFAVYLAALLVVMTLPTYTEEGDIATGIIMSGMTICAVLFIASMIRPDDFVFWSPNRTRVKAAFVYLGGAVALVSALTLQDGEFEKNSFVFMFTPAVLSLIALAGAVLSPAQLGTSSRAKALAVTVPLAAICLGGLYYLGSQTPPPELIEERRDFNNDFEPGSPEAKLIQRLDEAEEAGNFAQVQREIRQLSTIYEYQAALDWLKNRTFSNISEPRWSLLYALAAYDYKDSDGMRALEDTAAQVQVLGMTILRLDAARCVDEEAAMGKVRVWSTLSEDLVDNLNARSLWEKNDMTEAALHIESTIADRPAAHWICGNDPANVLNDSAWQKHRRIIRKRIADGILFNKD